jgi:type I restriction enzyme S subunit
MSELGEKVQTEEQPLPSGWMKLKLSAAIEPRGDKVSPANFPDLPFLGMDHVEAHTTKIIGSIPAREMKSNAARFYAGDILYGRLRPYLNKVAQPKNDGLASAEFIVFPENKLIKNSFLKYRLNARDFVNFANHLNEGDRPRVSFEQIGDFELLVPPATEQDRITNKFEELFSELDKGVENLRTAQQQLKVYRQALLKHAFEGKLTAEWRARNPDKLESAEALLARIRKERAARYQQQLAEWQKAQQAWEANGKTGSKPVRPKAPKALPPLTAEDLAELPELPEGWCYIYLACLGDLGRGKSKHRPRNDPRLFGGPYPFIQTGEVKSATRVVRKYSSTYSAFGLEQSKLWPAGTLCITIAANIAETAFLGFDGCFPDSVVGFSAARELVDPEYVDFFIQGARVRIEAYAPATAQKNINLETLENLVVPLCFFNEQRELLQILDERFSVIDQLENTIATSLQQAEALRQSILKKAFSGQLVPQHPDDEPASVLLARIRAERAAQPKARGRKSKAAA